MLRQSRVVLNYVVTFLFIFFILWTWLSAETVFITNSVYLRVLLFNFTVSLLRVPVARVCACDMVLHEHR